MISTTLALAWVLAATAPDKGAKPRSADAAGAQTRPSADSRDADARTEPASAERTTAERRDARRRAFREPGGPPDGRKWMIGLEGVVVQAPPLRPRALYLDPRFVGRSVAMGGVGLFGRFRPSPYLGLDLGVRSGSLRYQDRGSDDQISQDQVMADAGVLLYLGRGDIAQFALSGGMGGMYNRIGYDLDGSRDGVQTFGSGLVRLGGEAEFILKRVAFILSFRTYAVFTDRSATRNRGSLFAATPGARAPVAVLQTLLVGTAGIAYRF
jgi:hypothetical protein